MNLHYREIGQGEPIIILHGLYGSGDNWIQIANNLKDGYRVILPDLRNHGNSPHSEIFTIDEMVVDLMELADNLNIKQFILVGHSLGGRVAMAFAAKHEQRLKKLVIVDIAPFSKNSKKRFMPLLAMHRQILNGMISIPISSIRTRDEADKALACCVDNGITRQFLLKNLKRDNNQHFFWQLNLEVLHKTLEDHFIGQPGPSAKIHCTSLFIKGEKSAYLIHNDFPFISEIFPNATFETVLGSGHWVHAEKSMEFLEILTGFLQAN